MRSRLALEEYDYETIYRPGRLNQIADAVSRNPIEDSAVTTNQLTTNNNQNNETYSEFLHKLKTTIIMSNNLEEIGGNLVDSSDNKKMIIRRRKTIRFQLLACVQQKKKKWGRQYGFFARGRLFKTCRKPKNTCFINYGVGTYGRRTTSIIELDFKGSKLPVSRNLMSSHLITFNVGCFLTR